MPNNENVNYSLSKEIFKSVVRENGTDILNDNVKLEEALLRYGCDQTVVYQLLLLLQASNVLRYIPQRTTGISMVDINNIVINAEETTGLNRKIIKQLLSVIFYGLSMPTEFEQVCIPSSDKYTLQDIALIDLEKYNEDIALFEQAVQTCDVEMLAANSERFELLVKAGHPDALYLKGVCCLNGLSTASDVKLAKSYFTAAFHSGNSRAGAMLGDLMYENSFFSNTKAFKYYTSIGSVALDEKRKNIVNTFIEQQSVNKRTFIAICVLLVSTFVFNIMLGTGFLSLNGTTNWFPAIFSILINFVLFGVSVFSMIKFKYDSIKWIALAITAVTMLFAIIAL